MKNSRVRFFSTFLIGLFIISFQGGCEKDNGVDNDQPIEGLWIGTYTVNDAPALGNQYYSFVIKPDGKIIVDSKGNSVQHIAVGTWTLSGDAFTANFQNIYSEAPPSQFGVSQTATATFNASSGTLTGVWDTPAASVHNDGTFTLNRVD